MPEPIDFKYRAFLSYAHADQRWAKWLHGRLEGFAIDKDLVGRQTHLGPVPASLRPIFRDREDFSGGHSLGDATIAALDASAALIVLCSKVSATRPAVNEEVRLFRWRHPDRPVIPVILDGRPYSPTPRERGVGGSEGRPPHDVAQAAAPHPDPLPVAPPSARTGRGEEQCFPPALRFEIAPDGTITDRPVTILGPDVREEADGKERALAKIVAGLIGIPVEDVRKRQVIAEARRIRIVGVTVTAFVALAALAGFLWWQHERQAAHTAQVTRQMLEEREATRKQMEEQRAQLAALVQRLSLIAPAQAGTGSEQAIGAAVEAAAKGANAGDARLSRALDLLGAGNTKEAEALFRAVAEEKSARVEKDKSEAAAAWRHLGAIAGLADPKRAREAYAKALELEPDDMEALYWQGYLSYWAGDLKAAEAALERLFKIASAGNDQRGIHRAHVWLGKVMQGRGNLAAARDHEQRAVDIALRHAQTDNSPAWQRDLSEAQIRLGEVLVAQGSLADALKSYRAAHDIRDRLAKADPGNAGWQRDLSVSHNKIGDVLRAQGNLADALDAFNASLAIAMRLAQADPGNAGWQYDLGISNERIGDVLMAQGNLAGALQRYEAKRDIISRLAQAAPGNAGWQRDLSVSHIKIGDVLVEQGNLADALDAYNASLAIAMRLAQADPGNAGWQRDLSVSHDRIGDVLRDQGNLADALDAFNASLRLRERLAKADPGNAGWQRDVALSLQRVGLVAAQQGDREAALGHYRRGLGIMQKLVTLSPDHAAFKRDLAWFEARIAELERR